MGQVLTVLAAARVRYTTVEFAADHCPERVCLAEGGVAGAEAAGAAGRGMADRERGMGRGPHESLAALVGRGSFPGREVDSAWPPVLRPWQLAVVPAVRGVGSSAPWAVP